MVGNNVGNRKIRALFAKGSWNIFFIVNLSRPSFVRRFHFRGAVYIVINM